MCFCYNSKGEVTVFVNFGKMTCKLVESSAPSTSSEGSLLNMAVSGLVFIDDTRRKRHIIDDEEEVDEGTHSLELLVVVGYNGIITTFQPRYQ